MKYYKVISSGSEYTFTGDKFEVDADGLRIILGDKKVAWFLSWEAVFEEWRGGRGEVNPGNVKPGDIVYLKHEFGGSGKLTKIVECEDSPWGLGYAKEGGVIQPLA